MPAGFEMLVGAIIPVVGILLLAYWFSRFLGKRWSGGLSGRHLKIIDRLQVGADRYLLLVKLQDHTYLVGVSEKGIQLLAEPEGGFDVPEPDRRIGGFQDVLKTYGALKDKKGEKHE